MKFALNQNIEIISQIRSAAVEHALDHLRRDIQRGFSSFLSRKHLAMSVSCSLQLRRRIS